MSDRTSHTLIVHQTTPEEAGAFLTVIEEYGLDEFGPDVDAGDVALGEKYMCDEHPVGGSTDAATYLEKHAPNSVWTVWEDPKYEWLGSVYVHAPGLGSWTAACDANGIGYFSADEIRAAVRDGELDALLGAEWDAAVAAAQAQYADTDDSRTVTATTVDA
jgi:hypothetical protein